jgi:general secretion pathway protein I
MTRMFPGRLRAATIASVGWLFATIRNLVPSPPFRGRGQGEGAVRSWDARCRRIPLAVTSVWFGFALRSARPLTLTLSPEAGARGLRQGVRGADFPGVNHPRGRRAFTLLEVVLALALFFGALAALSQLTWNASRAAVQSRLRTQAVILCETKLNEILAGIEPLSDQKDVPYEDDPNWTWSLFIGDAGLPGLLQLEVTVAHTGGNSLGNVSQTLRRWTRDPQVFSDAAAAAAAASTTTSESSP